MTAFIAILAANEIDLSGLAVGLGVSGIAIALAIQSILGDAFSAFLIYFDRPFEVGDFIVVNGYSGTVKKIGIRSTRLQLLQGEELVISNKELTETSIRNFKKLRKRRVVFNVGVAADTPLEKLKKIFILDSAYLELYENVRDNLDNYSSTVYRKLKLPKELQFRFEFGKNFKIDYYVEYKLRFYIEFEKILKGEE